MFFKLFWKGFSEAHFKLKEAPTDRGLYKRRYLDWDWKSMGDGSLWKSWDENYQYFSQQNKIKKDRQPKISGGTKILRGLNHFSTDKKPLPLPRCLVNSMSNIQAEAALFRSCAMADWARTGAKGKLRYDSLTNFITFSRENIQSKFHVVFHFFSFLQQNPQDWAHLLLMNLDLRELVQCPHLENSRQLPVLSISSHGTEMRGESKCL